MQLGLLGLFENSWKCLKQQQKLLFLKTFFQHLDLADD